MISKVRGVLSDGGLASLMRHAIAFTYRRGVRPWMPGRPVLYAGIPVAYSRKFGDGLVPELWRSRNIEDRPEYEAALVSGLLEAVRPGDTIVVVGGGVGVTATIAALAAGASGRVQCFEGAAEFLSLVERTAKLNGVADRLTVHHAVVGRSVRIYGTMPDEQVVTPADLPHCDVLELDCEGAEVEILESMSIEPRVILVETHGLYGASTDRVASLLRRRGYRVVDRGVAEPRLAEFCRENDIRVLAGTRG